MGRRRARSCPAALRTARLPAASSPSPTPPMQLLPHLLNGELDLRGGKQEGRGRCRHKLTAWFGLPAHTGSQQHCGATSGQAGSQAGTPGQQRAAAPGLSMQAALCCVPRHHPLTILAALRALQPALQTRWQGPKFEKGGSQGHTSFAPSRAAFPGCVPACLAGYRQGGAGPLVVLVVHTHTQQATRLRAACGRPRRLAPSPSPVEPATPPCAPPAHPAAGSPRARRQAGSRGWGASGPDLCAKAKACERGGGARPVRGSLCVPHARTLHARTRGRTPSRTCPPACAAAC